MMSMRFPGERAAISSGGSSSRGSMPSDFRLMSTATYSLRTLITTPWMIWPSSGTSMLSSYSFAKSSSFFPTAGPPAPSPPSPEGSARLSLVSISSTSEWVSYLLISAGSTENAILPEKIILSLIVGNLNLFFPPDLPDPADQLLDDPLGRRCPRGHPHAGDLRQRLRRKLRGGLDVVDPRIEFPADLRQPAGVGAVVPPQDDHHVRVPGHGRGLLLPEHRRVADRVVDPHLRDLLERHRDELHQVLEGLGGLGDDPHLPDPGRLLDVGKGGEDGHPGLDVADDALHLGVVGVPHDGNRVSLAAQGPGVLLGFLHERAGGVDDLDLLAGQRLRVPPADAVGADDDLPARDVVHRLDHLHPLLLQLLHRLRIVDQGAQRMDGEVLRPRVAHGRLPRGLVGDGDGPLDAEAESRASGDENPLHGASSLLTPSGSRRSISSTTSSTDRVVVSRQIAPSATRSGESSRVLSWMSRCRTSRSTASKGLFSPPPHSRKRRSARTAACASRKNRASASGKTTVPVSRPSRTMPPRSPIFLWSATIASRTGRCVDTSDAPRLISGVRIAPSTSSPASRIRSPPPSSRRKSRGSSAHSRPSRGPSDHGIPALRAARAQTRYIAPVSSRAREVRCASRRETDVFPAPEGPSIVRIGRSLTGAPRSAIPGTRGRRCRCTPCR